MPSRVLHEINAEGVARSVGFFGETLEVLTQLLQSKRLTGKYDQTLAVHWGKNSDYLDERYGDNAWEYYFTQPFGNTVTPEDPRMPSHPGWHHPRGKATWGPFSVHRDGGQRLRAALQVHREVLGPGLIFDIRPDVRARLEAYARELLSDGNYIGVHRRATDWGHGPILPTEEFFSALDPYVDTGHNVMLLTEDERQVQSFVDHYGQDRVKTTDSCRSVDQQTGMPHTGAACGSPARHGYEVLQDAFVLSKCDVRLATSSNLCSFVEILNPLQQLDETLYPTVWGVEFESGVHGPLRRVKSPGWPNTSGW